MKHQDIRVGQTLMLKPERFADYQDQPTAYVLVTDIKPRKGYTVPWIMSDHYAYRPSDFSGIFLDVEKPL